MQNAFHRFLGTMPLAILVDTRELVDAGAKHLGLIHNNRREVFEFAKLGHHFLVEILHRRLSHEAGIRKGAVERSLLDCHVWGFVELVSSHGHC